MLKNRSKLWIVGLALVISVFSLSTLVLAYGEAPMLNKLVKEGKLPSVEERLPENPLVVEPVEKIGQYGGELYVVAQSLRGFGTDMHVIGFEPPLGLDPDSSVTPNVVERWTVSEDKTTWTLHLRKGIKWSDGVAFTANDIMYWWEDEVLNEDVTNTIYIPEFRNMDLIKLDDYTILIRLDEVYPMFQYTLSKQWGYLGKWWRPAHYLKQFNPKYIGKEKAAEMAKAEGFEDIRKFYLSKAGWSAKPVTIDAPTLVAYRVVEQYPDYWVWERNPYYWKVDTEGNQLPYIDRIVVKKIDDVETIQGQIVSGQVDIAVWNTSLENYPLYKQNEQTGNFRTLLWKTSNSSEVNYMPNQTVKDPILREIFQDVRFRRALSLGINRDEINDLLYFSQAIPGQFTLHPSSNYYVEEWAQAYAEYDPKRANQLLDEMGLDKKDSEGYRLRSDGKRVQFVIEYWPAEPATKTPMSELVREYWRDLGIEVALKPQSRSLNSQRAEANDVDMNVWHGGGVTDSDWANLLVPPLPEEHISWATAWGTWWKSDGKEGEEPPQDIKDIIAKGKELLTTTNETKRAQLAHEIWQGQADQIWYIGTVGMAPYPIVVKENLRNVPENGVFGGDLLWLHTYHPEQFYLEQK